LNQVSLTVYANQLAPTIYFSRDFTGFTSQPYNMIVTDPSLKFVTFNQSN
jgi:hypothetical protein